MPAYDTKGEPKKGVKYETESVPLTIAEFSQKKGIPANKIDFEILDVITTVYKNETIGNLTEEIIAYQKRGIPDMPEGIWLDPECRITQKYEVLLIPADANQIHLHVGVAANTHLTNIAAFIKKDLNILPGSGLPNFIISELNKKKLINGFFINVFDRQMRQDVDKLCNLISQRGKLDRDVKISLFSGPEFIPSKDDEINYVYQTKSQIPGGSKYIGVSSGDVLVEYIKPITGKASRSAKGKYINCYEPSQNYSIDFTISNSVKMSDSEEKTSYTAASDGFAVIEDGVLDVRPSLFLKNLTVKTGSIDTGTNKNAKLEITTEDPNIEAVGDGVKLKAFQLDVGGSVGDDTVLEADVVNITGQTHRTSRIIAREADIKTHKGIVNAESVKIGVLESGEVNANNVKVVSVLGAKVNATECKIDILGSNSVITVSKKLTIDTISGNENKIIVTPAATQLEASQFVELVEQLKEVKQLLLGSESELATNVKAIEQGLASAKAIKAKIDGETNKEIVAPLVSKLRAFNELVEKTKALKKEVADLNLTKDSLVQTIQSKQDSILQSKVVAIQDWRGHNTIKFKLIEPAEEIGITVDEKHNYSEVYLQKMNNIYTIGFEAR